MVNFPTWIPDCDSHSPALLDLFLSCDTSTCSTIAFPLLGNSDHVAVSVSIGFHSNIQWDATFHHIAYDYSCVDWDDLCDHLRYAPWEDIFKLGTSAADSEFCECVQVGIDVYIPYRKYQALSSQASLISMVFSCFYCCHSSYKSLFSFVHQKDKSSDSKVKFRQASNHCKRVLEGTKLAYANKTRVCYFPETWFSGLLENC